MSKEKCSCLLHCSDGWDRTSQVCAISQMLMDPYYRTIKGFEVLIQKDWISFGHQFRQRSGFGDGKHFPIFLQFMDCVWIVRSQFSEQFEFNENFLLPVIHHHYSGLFGTFLYNNDQERDYLRSAEKTVSLWTLINCNLEHYRNLLYDKEKNVGVLVPKADLKTISSCFWKGLYFRYNMDQNSSEKKLMKEILMKKDNQVKELGRKLRKERAMNQKLSKQLVEMKKFIKANLGDEFATYYPSKSKLQIIEDYFGK